MGALRCSCKNGVPYCAVHAPPPEIRNSRDLVQRIVDESRTVGKECAVVWIDDTAVVVVQNPARMAPRGPDLVPGFYVAKIHKGQLVSELFI